MITMLEKLAGQIGEGMLTHHDVSSRSLLNVFHRPVATFCSSDITSLSGMIANGLRGTAFIEARFVSSNIPQLYSAIRNHFPLVVNVMRDVEDVSTSGFQKNLKGLRDLDCVQLVARSIADHVHLLLIAHRIAELALVPVIIVADYRYVEHDQQVLPQAELISKFLGNPDDMIPSPTEAQKMIFGHYRRRVPNWVSFENPVALGIGKDAFSLTLEGAAQKKFFIDHLPGLVKQVSEEYHALTEYRIVPVSSTENKKCNYSLLTWDTEIAEFFPELSAKYSEVDFIAINQIRPFPSEVLINRLLQRKVVTILHPLIDRNNQDYVYNSIFSSLSGTRLKIVSGFYGDALNFTSLCLTVENMWSRHPRESFFIGIPFIRDHSNFPRHQVLIQELQKHYPELTDESICDIETSSESSFPPGEVATMLRRYQDRGPNFTRLSRFYDDTAYFYQYNQKEELIADPFSALPLMPVATGAFSDQSYQRKTIPVLEPNACTGCGECIVHCPHAAIPAVTVSIEQLLKSGSRIVTSRNMTVSRLTPLVKNISRVATRNLTETEGRDLPVILLQAFEEIVKQLQLEGDKLEAAKSEFDAIIEEVANFPFSINENFFFRPENISSGSGELFSLAIDPNACTGCGICTWICPENALEPVAETTEINSQTRRNYLLWEQLPDTPGDTIRRLQHDPDYSSLAATMLSRNFYRSLIGSGEDSAQEEKKIMHIITSLTEAILQPKVMEVVNKIGDYTERLAENVRNKLGDALPTENLEQLSETLQDIGRRKIHLADLMSRSQDGLKGKFIDSGDLQRKTDLLKSLKDLKWSLEEGPSGVGRSRFALVFDGHSMRWARKYPFNPMTQPTFIHEEGSISGDALGLFLGQLRYQIDHFKLLRRADLEVGDHYDPTQHDLSIAELNWSKLSNEERQLITPILVVIDRKFLDNNGWGELNRLLSVEYPVKIILLDDLRFSPEDTASLANVNAFMLGAISLKNAYIFQGGLGEIDHLFDGLMEGMHSPGPALFRIYINKDLDHHKINADKDLNRLVLDCRALPLLNFNPDRKKDFLRGAIHLEANQHVQEDWIVEKMKLPSGDVLDYAQSWADWAFTQEDWKSHFQLMTEVGNWDLVSLYILKNQAEREAVTPVIIRLEDEELKYYSVSREVVRATEISLDYWRTLREMSGRLFEYPQRLQAEVEKEIKHEYEKKLDDLANDFHARLHEQEKIHMQKIREALKQRLVALSKMSKNKMGN